MDRTFRDIGKLSNTLKFLLGANVVFLIVLLWSAWLQYQLLSGGSFSMEDATANDDREQALSRAFLVFHVITIVVFAIWIVRANKNVRALGALELRHSPGWAVGYFFVPFASLWLPFQAMTDLWKASKDARGWQAVPLGAILRPWWTLWIICGVLGQISFRLALAAKDIDSLQAATIVEIADNVFEIPLHLVAYILVAQIQSAQADQSVRDLVMEPAMAV